MADDQAVLVYLGGNDLPDSVYKEYDLSTLEDQLIEVIQGNTLGEFDGNEFGPEETILYRYRPDADKLFAGVESVLRSYPLRTNARVIIRRAPPGSPEREIVLKKALVHQRTLSDYPSAGDEVGRYNQGRMEITLNPALQARIEEKLRIGEFSSATALVEQAVTLFLESEGDEMDAAEFSATRSAVDQGLVEAEKGEAIPLEEFDRMMRTRHGISR